ncbi:hypothetical protein F9C11_00585 [Amycolatopsis sp. VS8301801F10]|uniref:hypothetical protein n=1 Tax=Amycolatopsis sp. VS8301801F10 TaxID=2652442 RepID=UPI0038FBF17A
MQHARDIKDKAVELTIKEHDQKYATQSGMVFVPESVKRHYAFIESMFEPFSEEQFAADASEAAAKLIQDFQSQVDELKKRYYE